MRVFGAFSKSEAREKEGLQLELSRKEDAKFPCIGILQVGNPMDKIDAQKPEYVFDPVPHFDIRLVVSEIARGKSFLPAFIVLRNQFLVGRPHTPHDDIARGKQAPLKFVQQRDSVEQKPLQVLAILKRCIMVAHEFSVVHQVVGDGRINR